jgi:hypothetical protein
MQCACSILSPVACPAQQYFPTLSHTQQDFEKSYWTQNVCFGFRHRFCLKHLSFKEELSEIWSKIYIGLHVKYPLFLYDFNQTWISTTVFRKIAHVKFHVVQVRSYVQEHGRDSASQTNHQKRKTRVILFLEVLSLRKKLISVARNVKRCHEIRVGEKGWKHFPYSRSHRPEKYKKVISYQLQ